MPGVNLFNLTIDLELLNSDCNLIIDHHFSDEVIIVQINRDSIAENYLEKIWWFSAIFKLRLIITFATFLLVLMSKKQTIKVSNSLF